MLKIEYKPVSFLKAHERNPRNIRERDFEVLKQSIRDNPEYFEVRPILATPTGRVFAGNMRLRAALALGMQEVPVAIMDVSPEKERELMIRDNVQNGQWDHDILGADFEMGELEAWGVDLTDFGVKNTAPVQSPPVPEPPAEVISKLGEVYDIGPHRLLCGSATDEAAIARLFDGHRAAITFTSPPYNAGKSEALSGNTHSGDNKYQEHDDDMEQGDWLELMAGYMREALRVSDYVFTNVQSLAGNRTALWEWAGRNAEGFCDVAIWDKGHAAPAMAENVMNSVFEFIFIHALKKPNRAIRTAEKFRGTLDNIFRIPPQHKNEFSEVHAATFPVELPHAFIDNFTKPGDIIFDPFAGTGTTMIAADQLGRRCFMVELDPRYCDVIRQRYEDFKKD